MANLLAAAAGATDGGAPRLACAASTPRPPGVSRMETIFTSALALGALAAAAAALLGAYRLIRARG